MTRVDAAIPALRAMLHLVLLASASVACLASELPLVPDVRKATMTGDRLPARWTVNRAGLTGFDTEVDALESKGANLALPLRLVVDSHAVTEPEGYRLDIRQAGIRVTGADRAGVFYELKTLGQLVALSRGGVPCGVIEDSPAFRIRGFMHDTGRNFQSVAMLKAQLDRFADYKLNVFHWHLTDRPGWRIECKSYPILNDPSTRLAERDPNATYSYSDIRDVVAYARARHIQVIPEIDMPGHSDYFKKAFGFEMGDPRALPILKNLIAEFCQEIPASDCPILHIGSDEVRIQEPKAFISAITSEVRRHGRTPMMWNPGLPNDGSAIDQLWRDWQTGAIPVGKRAGVVDSGLGYINYYDPWEVVRRYYFLQTCGVAKGDSTSLGGSSAVGPTSGWTTSRRSRPRTACGRPSWPSPRTHGAGGRRLSQRRRFLCLRPPPPSAGSSRRSNLAWRSIATLSSVPRRSRSSSRGTWSGAQSGRSQLAQRGLSAASRRVTRPVARRCLGRPCTGVSCRWTSWFLCSPTPRRGARQGRPPGSLTSSRISIPPGATNSAHRSASTPLHGRTGSMEASPASGRGTRTAARSS